MTMALNNEEIGKRIQYTRKCKKISQEQLATILEITLRHMAHIETGQRGLTPENAILIADAFDITLDYIYRGKETSEDMTPVCQLVYDTLAHIQDAEQKEFYRNQIINLSHHMLKL